MNCLKKTNKKFTALSVVAGFGILFLLFASINASAGQQAPPTLPVKPIDPAEVCMVNDAVMGKPQIPVMVGDKTYYGCCNGCASTLQNKRHMRYSNDPLTGKEVDKASAFILTGPAGRALYFESSETALKYVGYNR